MNHTPKVAICFI